MSKIEIDNQINLIKSRIEQMENHELFNDREKVDNIKKLNKELDKLTQEKINEIEVINPEVQ